MTDDDSGNELGRLEGVGWEEKWKPGCGIGLNWPRFPPILPPPCKGKGRAPFFPYMCECAPSSLFGLDTKNVLRVWSELWVAGKQEKMAAVDTSDRSTRRGEERSQSGPRGGNHRWECYTDARCT